MARNAIRLARLCDERNRIFMVPMDHGVSMGPAAGISPPGPTLDAVTPYATCVTVHKGLIPHVAPYARDVGVLLHLSASTDLAADPNEKRIVATVEEALRMGCDGVSTHLNLGSNTEADQIQALGAVSTTCNEWGVPHIAMVYPRGQAILDPFDPDLVAHAARLGAELGADAVKVPYTGDTQTMRPAIAGAGVPVIVAGGPKTDNFAGFLANIRGAVDAGASGVSIGRNVFQAHDPAAAMKAITELF
jgi:fructose-bisphosphate aldolase/2-amino-3,7-dideoxy-D-threo-hept-6-ulosonate synthase